MYLLSVIQLLSKKVPTIGVQYKMLGTGMCLNFHFSSELTVGFRAAKEVPTTC